MLCQELTFVHLLRLKVEGGVPSLAGDMWFRLSDTFSVFYVMTEGVEKAEYSKWSVPLEIFYMLIDLLSVIRTVSSVR
jgi:hypothetical protein